jgi:putative ABC transport system permease protein
MSRWLEGLVHDLAYALRSFRRSQGFVSVALLSLMLGIGATTAIFSVVYGVLVDPYPYARAHEIWAPQIRALDGRSARGSQSIDEFLQLGKLPAFSDAMATGSTTVLLTGDFAPESFRGVLLTGNAFHFLGVPPLLGRTIQPGDIGADGEPAAVVVLGHRLWLRLFNGDPAAIGKTLRLNDRPHSIIGVMPPRFGWYGNEGFWLPLGTSRREGGMVNPIMRLAPGVTPAAAEAQLHALFQQMAHANPSAFPKDGFTTRLVNYLDVTVASGEMQTSLRLLFGAVVFLLLIACANVANLQLARGTARSREMAVRMSIGAGRRRLLRQLLTENVLLAVIGGALGVLFAFLATNAIVSLMPEFYVPNESRVAINMTVLIFSLAVSLLTGIIFGVVPALQASKPDLTDALKEGSRGAGGAVRSGRTRSVLVVVEVALSVVLLVSAALAVRTFLMLQRVDLGIRADRVLLVGVPLPTAKYKTLEQRNLFAQQLLDRVTHLPGVEATALGNGGLPFGGPQSPYAIQGQPAPEGRRVTVNLTSAGYLATLGIPLRAGRAFDEHEVLRGDRVAIVNEAAARLWPAGENPIGSRVHLALLEKSPDPNLVLASGAADVTVIGIAANTRNYGPRNEPSPVVMIPYTLAAPVQRMLAVHASGNPMLLLNPIREQVRALDKDQPLSRPITIEEVLGSQTVQPRFTMALFGLFATLGLALAAAGIYSVLSFHVTRRTHEIGVRMALGARRADMSSLMLAMGGRLIALGIALGGVASFASMRLLRSQLFGVEPTDPIAYVAVTVLLSIVGLAACYVPAQRAAAVDPMIALRHE